MSNSELDIIAFRAIWEEGIEGEPIPITINICRPFVEKYSDDQDQWEDWGCMYQILRNGDDTRRTIYGVDSIQALFLSLQTAGVELSSSDIQTPSDDPEHSVWTEENSYGFPRWEYRNTEDSASVEIEERDTE